MRLCHFGWQVTKTNYAASTLWTHSIYFCLWSAVAILCMMRTSVPHRFFFHSIHLSCVTMTALNMSFAIFLLPLGWFQIHILLIFLPFLSKESSKVGRQYENVSRTIRSTDDSADEEDHAEIVATFYDVISCLILIATFVKMAKPITILSNVVFIPFDTDELSCVLSSLIFI